MFGSDIKLQEVYMPEEHRKRLQFLREIERGSSARHKGKRSFNIFIIHHRADAYIKYIQREVEKYGIPIDLSKLELHSGTHHDPSRDLPVIIDRLDNWLKESMLRFPNSINENT